jgi:heterodisulfide reductase subunit A-like polyferredoxin
VAEYGLMSAIEPSALQAAVDENLCTGCELCLDRCQFGALSIADSICRIDEKRCFGCGLCVSECPDEALSLAQRTKGRMPAPPKSMPDWLMERAGTREIDVAKLEDVIGKLAGKKSA